MPCEAAPRRNPPALGHLEIKLAGNLVSVVPITRDRLVIGRDSQCHLHLEGRFVSRRHAMLARRGAEVLIEDLDSKNGVLVNSERVASRVLQSGDVIGIGDYRMIFHPVRRLLEPVNAELELDSIDGAAG